MLLFAFRKRYSCDDVLVKLIDICKQALDSGEHMGICTYGFKQSIRLLTPSAAGLLLCKSRKYGVSPHAC